jgi:hypothetical protein
MKQIARNLTQMLDDVGVKRVPLSPRSPWLNGFTEMGSIGKNRRTVAAYPVW